ncbi:MAG TPA: cytochrome P450 [Streptosporangiaceae bacterium]
MAGTAPEAFPFRPLPDDHGTPTRLYDRAPGCPRGQIQLPSGDLARFVRGHGEVDQVLKDRRFSRNFRYQGAPRMVAGDDMSTNPDAIVNLDPRAHPAAPADRAGRLPTGPAGRQAAGRPGRGLADELIAAADGGALSEAELYQIISALFIGGQENISAVLARGIATRPRGHAVQVSIPSANRDPGRFAEPDGFDLRRSPNPHLSFGAGPHFCVGAPLARVELQVALGAIAARLPGLRLAVDPGELSYTQDTLVRALHSLPVTW